MRITHFEKELIKKIENKLSHATPGIQIQVHQHGKKICDISAGHVYPYYDYASLTKIIFTVQAMMLAFEQKKWNLQTKVKDILADFSHENMLIKDLLTHSSGLVWWAPLYKEINEDMAISERWQKYYQWINQSKLELKDESVYSDLGFITLGLLLQKIYDQSLVDVWKKINELFYDKMTIHFNYENKPTYALKHYAPTENCPWRGRVLQGEVHDENAWALGGVSSHAGLFGSIDDLGWYALSLRAQLLGVSRSAIKPNTQKIFASRARDEGTGDWALGYMLPSPGSSSAGRFFSLSSIGHTGFTGTSVWYDLKDDLSVVMLSNRVALGRASKEFAILRPEIHNWIREGLLRS